MKQIQLSLLALSLTFAFTNAMEMPTERSKEPSKDSKVSTSYLLAYMENSINRHDAAGQVGAIRYALAFACRLENPEVFEFAFNWWQMLPEASFFSSGKSINDLVEPLLISASFGRINFVEQLLKRSKGQIVNAFCSTHPNTALDYATRNGCPDMVRLLLSYGANPNLRIEKKLKTPLMTAIELDKLECTQALLAAMPAKANPDSSCPDESLSSILNCALAMGTRNEHVKALIEHGADVNYINPHNNTPLMIAIVHANEEGVKILLDAKARTDSKFPDTGVTVAEYVQMNVKLQNGPSVWANIAHMLAQAEAESSNRVSTTMKTCGRDFVFIPRKCV